MAAIEMACRSPWPHTVDFDGEVPESTSSPFPVFRTQVSSAIADHPEHRAIPLLDHPHSLIPALTATARPAATGAATGVSKAPSCSTAALRCTARSSGWCSGPTRIGQFVRLLGESTEESGA